MPLSVILRFLLDNGEKKQKGPREPIRQNQFAPGEILSQTRHVGNTNVYGCAATSTLILRQI